MPCSHKQLLHLDAAPAVVPAGLRVPGDWPFIAIDGRGVEADLPPQTSPASASPPASVVPDDRTAEPHAGRLLRVAVALDVREAAEVAVESVDTGQTLGVLACHYACALQYFSLPLPDPLPTGRLRLRRLDRDEPIYLIAAQAPVEAFAPQLIAPLAAEPWARFRQAFDSPASLTQFGWMEGCVLDGLHDLHLTQTLDDHLDFFFPGEGFIAEDFHSRPIVGRLPSMELTNGFAALARRRPDHPALDQLLDSFAQHTRPDGIIEGGFSAAEHAYTVAYPLAVIAAARGQRDLAVAARTQLDHLMHGLRDDDGHYWLRRFPDGRQTFRNWSRGVAWLLLGLARTMAELPAELHPAGAPEFFARAADRLAGWQRRDGLWNAYLDDGQTFAETSGSAGIAAALALAAKHGWLDPAALDLARRCRQGLETHIGPDGLIGGMSQSNKAEAGQDLQRSSFRVRGGAVMGLAAQLIAALNHQA